MLAVLTILHCLAVGMNLAWVLLISLFDYFQAALLYHLTLCLPPPSTLPDPPLSYPVTIHTLSLSQTSWSSPGISMGPPSPSTSGCLHYTWDLKLFIRCLKITWTSSIKLALTSLRSTQLCVLSTLTTDFLGTTSAEFQLLGRKFLHSRMFLSMVSCP